MSAPISNQRPLPDQVISDIADYVMNYEIKNELAWTTAHYCLLDTLGCGFEALSYPACTKLLGPIVPGTIVPNGARVPGTSYQLDPIQAAFNIGAIIRWLDLMIPGWLLNGDILLITSEGFWLLPTGSQELQYLKGNNHC